MEKPPEKAASPDLAAFFSAASERAVFGTSFRVRERELAAALTPAACETARRENARRMEDEFGAIFDILRRLPEKEGKKFYVEMEHDRAFEGAPSITMNIIYGARLSEVSRYQCTSSPLFHPGNPAATLCLSDSGREGRLSLYRHFGHDVSQVFLHHAPRPLGPAHFDEAREALGLLIGEMASDRAAEISRLAESVRPAVAAAPQTVPPKEPRP